MSRIKVGVVGVGHMGKEHARIYAESNQCDLVGVFDQSAEVGLRVAQQHNVRNFSQLEDLLHEVDAVSIATPTQTHTEIARQALNSGKHVLVEKPLAPSMAEARELVALAAKKNCLLQVGHIERFNPILEPLEKTLSEPRFIEVHRLSPYPHRSTDIGVVLDLMIHDLEIVLHLVKSPLVSVDAVGVPIISDSEDIATARLKFANGCIANLTTSRVSPEKLRKIRLFQKDMYISLDYQGQKGDIYRKQGGQITLEKLTIEPQEPLRRQLESFVQCIQEESKPRVDGQQAAKALALALDITEMIRQSPDFAASSSSCKR